VRWCVPTKDSVLLSRVGVLVRVMAGVVVAVVVVVRGDSEGGVVVPVVGRVEDVDEEEDRVSEGRPIARRNASLRAMLKM